MKRKRYPFDLTDAQWAILEPEIPKAKLGGRPRKTNMRHVVNAVFYLTREGCTWRALPHDFPPWKAVYNYFESGSVTAAASSEAIVKIAEIHRDLHRLAPKRQARSQRFRFKGHRPKQAA